MEKKVLSTTPCFAGFDSIHKIFGDAGGTMFDSIAVLGGPEAMTQLVHNY